MNHRTEIVENPSLPSTSVGVALAVVVVPVVAAVLPLLYKPKSHASSCEVSLLKQLMGLQEPCGCTTLTVLTHFTSFRLHFPLVPNNQN